MQQVQIDPATGEVVEHSQGGVQIDPATGEVMGAPTTAGATAHTAAKPTLWQTMKSNFNKGTQAPPPPTSVWNMLSPKRAVENVGAGAGNFIRSIPHMLEKGKPETLDQILARGQQETEAFSKDPVGAYTKKFGEVGTGALAGEAVAMPLRGVARAVREHVVMPAARNATSTTPKATAADVAEASGKNAAEVQKAEEANAKLKADRQLDLKKHFDKTQQVKEQNAAGEAPTARKEALNRGVAQLDVKFKDDLTTLKKKSHAAADAEFVALADRLNDIEAQPEFLPQAVTDASEKFKGSNTEPAIFKDMEKRLGRGERVPYRDLQGYYSEIGKELSKGTLPGDVYQAYATLQDAVGTEMQRIADANGLGPQLTHARASWRQLKETFYNPRSPVTRALKAVERGKSIAALQGADQSGIQAIARYDPELARRANTIRGHQAEAKAIHPSTRAEKPTPKLEPPKPPVEPQTQTLSPETLQQMKAKRLAESTEKIRNARSPIVNAFAGYGIIKDLLRGNLMGAGLDMTARLLYGTAKPIIADMLDNPRVVQELTKFSARDAEAIQRLPPEQRTAFVGDMTQVVDAAKKKGIPIAPALIGILVSPKAPPKRVAAALQPVGAP